jgi:hypothetical protein
MRDRKPPEPERPKVALCVCGGTHRPAFDPADVSWYCPSCGRNGPDGDPDAAKWNADQRALREHELLRAYLATVCDHAPVRWRKFFDRFGIEPSYPAAVSVLARLAELEEEAMG